MSSAKITLLGFYNYNNALFDEMVLPDGVDKETLVDTILMRGAEYECIYSDPSFMQKLIGSWSLQWKKVFEKWQEVTNTDFAPLENYDRFEDWSDTKQSNEKSVGVDRTNTTGRDDVTRSNIGSHSDTNSTTNTNTVSGSGSTSGNDATVGSGSTDDTKTTSAYNSNNFVNADKDVQSNSTRTESATSTTSSSQSSANETSRENGSSNDRTDETTNANKLLNSTSNNETTRDYNDVSVHTSRIHGNIGVTTSSAMYREFYELMLQYGNIYNSIATVFLQAFVIPIL